MKSTEQYLDEVRERLELPSDYALAGALGLTRAAVSSYRVGRSMPDDLACARIADALGCEPMEVIAAINYQRAKTDEARALWEGIWGKVVGAIALNSPASKVGSSVVPSTKGAASGKPEKPRNAQLICIMSNCYRRRTASNDARRFAA